MQRRKSQTVGEEGGMNEELPLSVPFKHKENPNSKQHLQSAECLNPNLPTDRIFGRMWGYIYRKLLKQYGISEPKGTRLWALSEHKDFHRGGFLLTLGVREK